ncbi:uncharacterized protein N7482_003486 [Penicillium canariense]|uniref:Uncharacterized protein n=1 Tax=Penicillium canariense TaxID=189055 RepID=A0A9W9LNP9_9EURO|nr:uncharacterized protein N7482_003486 [Penicillium canariense]KAJ5167892.1 hypothetical protein N7482_003486 [Penicillium canariense]
MTTHGTASIAMIILVLHFESCCFATIFTLALRGLGRHTKLGGSMLVAAISGGMVFPPMMGCCRGTSIYIPTQPLVLVTNADVLSQTHVSAHTAMAIPIMGYILAMIFPIYVNIYKKDTMDLHRNTEVNVKVPVSKEFELEEGNQSKPTAKNAGVVGAHGPEREEDPGN